MRGLCYATIAICVCGSPAHAGAQRFQEEWPPIVERLRDGEVSDNGRGLRSAREACVRLLMAAEVTDPQRMVVRSALAYANWRLVRVPGLELEERDRLLDEAQEQLGHVIAAAPADAEAIALRSSVYGAVMSFAPMKGAALGANAFKDISRALELAPNNPRVLLQEAMRLYHTPPQFGGDRPAAEAQMRRAIAMFATEPSDRPWPNWGRIDAHVWLGQMLASRGDKVGARAEYDKALLIAPGHTWVRDVLIPALDKMVHR